ncbi:glycerate kinase [Chloroflexota bacterium]
MGIIQHREALATTPLRAAALDIVEAGIARVLPARIMGDAVRYDATDQVLKVAGDAYRISRGRFFVIGGGKAAGLMAAALERIIGSERITAGVVTDKGTGFKTKKVRVLTAGHPVPDERGTAGVREMLSLKEQHQIGQDDIVLCLISGGGSALLPYPVAGVSLEDKQGITELLLGSGAEITEINTVRKHLSRIKGGQLGKHFAPATVISLILSDVIGDDLSSITSGLTYPDTTTFRDACQVLERYQLRARAPHGVTDYLEKGLRHQVPETPRRLSNCHNYIIGNNHLALEAMRQKAEATGFAACLLTGEQRGETAAVAQYRAEEIINGTHRQCSALLIGGETTPGLPLNPGRGGRNQHYALVTMRALRDYPRQWVMASVGTDGSDFLPDVAGAVVDSNSLPKAAALGLDALSYLERYDSNTLLSKLGDSLIVTGNTGTNVGDVVVYLFDQDQHNPGELAEKG